MQDSQPAQTTPSEDVEAPDIENEPEQDTEEIPVEPDAEKYSDGGRRGR